MLIIQTVLHCVIDKFILVQPLPPLCLRKLSHNGWGLILIILCCSSSMLSQKRRKNDCAFGGKSWPAGKVILYPDVLVGHLQTRNPGVRKIFLLKLRHTGQLIYLRNTGAWFLYHKHWHLESRKGNYCVLLILTSARKINPREKFLKAHLLGLSF